MNQSLVQTQGLTKHYGPIRAVDGLDLHIEPGEVYGFLGPNGSGKSTTILMLLGLTEPTAGTVSVVGYDPTRKPTEVKRHVGYLPEAVGFYGDLSGRRNLLYTAELNSIPPGEASARVDELLEMVQLTDSGNRPVSQYSRGMRQRLGLADVLLKRPKLVILDDPTLGLDPAGIQWLLGLIEEMATVRNIAVFLSSHQLHEVQRVCNRVGIMSRGNLVLEGTVSELTAQHEGGGFEVQLEVSAVTKKLTKALESIDGVTGCRVEGNIIIVASSTDVRALLTATAVTQGATLYEARSRNRSLEDIYLRYFHEPVAAAL